MNILVFTLIGLGLIFLILTVTLLFKTIMKDQKFSLQAGIYLALVLIFVGWISLGGVGYYIIQSQI